MAFRRHEKVTPNLRPRRTAVGARVMAAFARSIGMQHHRTPQGGPLSPLLSNLMLDVLDKELEKRGHRFVRYADDCAPRRRKEEATM